MHGSAAANGVSLEVLGVLDVPEELPTELPNAVNPSDHLPLIAEFRFHGME